MQLNIAKSAGFCVGVERAVSLAYEYASDDVYLLGELIHNEYVNDKILAKGVKIVDSTDDIPELTTVIIRSHGVSKNIIRSLEDKSCKIIDTTCHYVKKIHNIVQEHHSKGDKIIIIGKPNHPEVIGINGWCDDSGIVISGIDDIPSFDEGNYCVVVQTTYDVECYQQIAKVLKKLIKIVAIYETICYTTKVRQQEALELAQKSDLMLVIGSKNSSNTMELYNICLTKCPRTYLIFDKTECNSVKILKNDIVGVTAGASTPKEMMMEVINTMVNQKEGVTEVIEEVAKDDITATATTDSVKQQVADEKKPVMNEELTMADVMKKTKFFNLRAGKKVKGNIIRATEDGLYVNIGLGKDGFITKEEISIDNYSIDDYPIGDEIEAIVVAGTSKEYISLSKKKADILKKEEAETERILMGNEFSLVINEAVRGGLIGKMGSYTVFVPASEIKLGYVNDLEQYKGKTLRLRAIAEKEKTDDDGKKRRKNPKRIVASQRIILAEEKDAKEEHFWAEMIPGNIVEGKVKRFAPFGVFVQVMGFDCLVHISDVSWVKIEDPSEILKINEIYEFEILKVDREKGRVSLSYKSLQKTPYEIASEKYPVGTVIKGKVDRLATFGAFIKIDDGVDGLVHVSQISHDWIKDASQALKVGEEVEAKVIKFEDNKITLSIKELLPEPEENEQGSEEESKRPYKKRETKTKSNNDFREWVAEEDSVTIGDLFAGLKDIVPEDDDKE